MNLTELKDKPVNELVQLADSMGLENMARLRKQDIIFAILKAHAKSGEDIHGGGVLEILQLWLLAFSRLVLPGWTGRYLRLAKPNSSL